MSVMTISQPSVLVRVFPKGDYLGTDVDYKCLAPGESGEDLIGYDGCPCSADGSLYRKVKWDERRNGWSVVVSCEKCGWEDEIFVEYCPV